MIYIEFAEIPTSEMIELEDVEQIVVCRCRHMSTEAVIGWRVNGLPSGQFPDITTGSIDENGARVHTLTIPARSEYNGTQVVCVAAFLDGSLPESTPPAILVFITGLSESSTTTIAIITLHAIP